MDPSCYICRGPNGPGVCPKCEHIAGRFKELELRIHKAESISYWMQQTFDTLFREVSKDVADGKEVIEVPAALLEAALKAVHADHKADHRTDLILIGMIVADAADMLRARGTNLEAKVRGMLKKHLLEYYKFHGWDDEWLEQGTRISRNVWDAEPIE